MIGGSGFYEFLDDAREVTVETPYGEPSAPLAIGTVGGTAGGVPAAARRGPGYPPHRINYRANMWALRRVGVRQVLAPCAVGGLRPSVAPGELVVPDQLVDRTRGRVQTYVERGAAHVPFADPYCVRLRRPGSRPPVGQAWWCDGGGRGAAVLDACGVAVVRRGGLERWST